MRTEIAIAAVALAALSLVLFVLALRRLLARQAEVTITMLRRYDERLAAFAQTLNDTLTAVQSARRLGALELEDDPEPMMRTLEIARERTARRRRDRARDRRERHADRRDRRPVGVRDEPHRPHGLPRLSRRTRDRGRVLRRPRRARGAGARPRRARHAAARRARSRTACSASSRATRRRRFSEEDVDALDGLVERGAAADLAGAEPPRAGRRAGARHAHEPARPAVVPVGDRPRDRPRAAREPSAVAARARRRPAHGAQRADRDPRRGRRAARAREAAPRRRAPPRLRVPARRRPVRGRPARAPRGSTRASCSRRSAPSSRAIRSATRASISVSGGVAELLTRDDAESFAARAEAALGHAKRAGPGNRHRRRRRRGPFRVGRGPPGDRDAREPGHRRLTEAGAAPPGSRGPRTRSTPRGARRRARHASARGARSSRGVGRARRTRADDLGPQCARSHRRAVDERRRAP